jgi:hypothetical protein
MAYDRSYALAKSSASGSGAGASSDMATAHPSYTERMPDWIQMRDTWSGQRAVKSKGLAYLPASDGMIKDGLYQGGKGANAYHAYLTRAVFHSFVADAVDTMNGMMWTKPPRFDLPESGAMDYLKHKATNEGEGLHHLLRAINRQQLITGRLGLLVDLPANETVDEPRPYISMYHAEKIINWDAGFRGESDVETTNLVVLDESGPKRQGLFQWIDTTQFRVLMLGDPENNENEGVYRFGVFTGEAGGSPTYLSDQMRTATSRGTPFDHIPWVFINANSTTSTVCEPPILGLSDLTLALYRLEADYRQALFMQTQDTLFTKGFDHDKENPLRIGAGGHIHARSDKADAKWIGVTSEGLPQLALARDTDLKMCASKAGELMDASSRARESGTALEMRIGSKTATMHEIAIAGAEGLQRALRDVGQWIGLKESELEKIVVIPNTEFASREFAAMDFKNIVETKMLGGAVSWRAIHKWSAERGGPGKDLTFDEMMKQIVDEGILQDVLAPAPDPAEDNALELQQEQHDMDLEHQQEAHDQKLTLDEEVTKAKIAAQKKAAASKPKTKPATKK